MVVYRKIDAVVWATLSCFKQNLSRGAGAWRNGADKGGRPQVSRQLYPERQPVYTVRVKRSHLSEAQSLHIQHMANVFFP